MERLHYIKDIDGKWYDVLVEFNESGVGNVIDVKITNEPPEFDERLLIYAQQ